MTIPTTPAVTESIRDAVQAFQNRHIFWPPEMWQRPCDLHEQWAREWLEANLAYTNVLLKDGSQADFDLLLSDVFKEDIWAANRRAFFGELHKKAVTYEATGGTVSSGVAAFYRSRYMPHHMFLCEAVAPVPMRLFIPSIFQKPSTLPYADDDDDDSTQ